MTAAGVIPALNVPGYIAVGVRAGGVLRAVDPLVLQCSEERLRHRIIVADLGAADGLPEVMLFQRRRELAGCVITAAVGVKDSILAEPVLRAAISIACSMSGVL